MKQVAELLLIQIPKFLEVLNQRFSRQQQLFCSVKLVVFELPDRFLVQGVNLDNLTGHLFLGRLRKFK